MENHKNKPDEIEDPGDEIPQGDIDDPQSPSSNPSKKRDPQPEWQPDEERLPPDPDKNKNPIKEPVPNKKKRKA